MTVSANEIHVTLPDGSVRSLPVGSTGLDLASNIGSRLAKAAVGATINGEQWDLLRVLPDGASAAIITAESEPGRHILRHSTAHLMAQAVIQLFPGTKFSIGPAIEDGFYYDFELPDGRTFSQDDLASIDVRMREIISAKIDECVSIAIHTHFIAAN